MPSALAITRSIGVVTKPRTRSALAPTYTVVTCITAMSLRGYCRTLRERIACKPAMRITRFTTTASTGRLTNRSVNFMSFSSGARGREGSRLFLLRFLYQLSSLLLATLGLAVLGLWIRIISGLDTIVHQHRGAIAKTEDPGAHYLIARIQAGRYGDLIAARAFNFHHLLAYSAIGVPLRILHVGDDVNGIAVRRIVDCRGWQRHNLTRRAQGQFDLYKHPRPQLVSFIAKRRLYLDVSGLLIDHRVKRGDLPAESHTWQ